MNDEDLQALDALTGAVDALRKELRAERATRKWQGIAVVALIMVGLTVNGLLLLKVRTQADELAGNRVADCIRGNASRAALLDIADAMPVAIFSALVTVTGEGRTPEQQARAEKLGADAVAIVAESTAEQRAALAPRDCNPAAVNP